MERFRLRDAGQRGWFVGQFDGAVFKTDACEVAYQFNAKGDHCAAHTHKIATEINLIASGSVTVGNETFSTGEGFIMTPGDICECRYHEDTYTVVVKVPGVLNDKYLIE